MGQVVADHGSGVLRDQHIGKVKRIKGWEGDMIAWIKARIRVLILDIENYVYLVELNLQYCLSSSVDVL